MTFVRRTLRWAARWAACSVWWPLAGKALAGLLAFAALAHVGTGAAAHLNAASVAKARAAPLGVEPDPVVATASATATAAPSASCEREEKPSEGWTADGKLILNQATATDFTKLPGIGTKRAGAIVALRTKLGRFKRVRDLLRIRGIGYRLLQKLKPLVVVDAPRGKG